MPRWGGRAAPAPAFALALVLALPVAAQPPGVDPVLSAAERQVSPHVWAIAGYPHVFIVTGSAGTLVIDTGMGTPNGRFVADAAARRSRGGRLYLATTHEHPEHAAGFGGFPPGTVLIRSRAQEAEVQAGAAAMVDRFRSRSPEWARLLEDARFGAAAIVFDDEYRLDLGDVHVRMVQAPPAHTDADMLFLIEEDGALATGDIIQARSVPNPIGRQSTIAGWLRAIDMADAMRPRLILPTHTAPGGADLIAVNRAMLGDVMARARAARAAGRDAPALEAELRAAYGNWQNPQNLATLARKAMAEAN